MVSISPPVTDYFELLIRFETRERLENQNLIRSQRLAGEIFRIQPCTDSQFGDTGGVIVLALIVIDRRRESPGSVQQDYLDKLVNINLQYMDNIWTF